ncbi:hypothetical protein B0H11DRAFT_2079572 [Mycena galericulata]|nr:hypothetical protein B0H11DRAFT_2079572 [Mycena galericulata]
MRPIWPSSSVKFARWNGTYWLSSLFRATVILLVAFALGLAKGRFSNFSLIFYTHSTSPLVLRFGEAASSVKTPPSPRLLLPFTAVHVEFKVGASKTSVVAGH